MKKINIKQVLIENTKYILIVLTSFVLFLLCSLFIDDKILDNYIKRPGVGEYDTEMEIRVEGLTDKPQNMEIPVSSRRYSYKEAKEALGKGIDILVEIIPGENESLQNVTSKLNLVSEIRDLGLNVKWDCENSDLVDIFGNVYNENIKENIDLNMEATLSYGNYEEKYLIPIRVCPRSLSENEKLVKGLSDYVKDIDRSQVESEGYRLPESFEGKRIVYKNGNTGNYHLIWIMGIAFALLLFLREKRQKQDERDRRQKSLIKDYPDIVSKLMVFIGAGLSIRQSLESIVNDYETDLKSEKRYAYEELAIALSKLKTGTYESTVYKEFGRSCGVKQYMKLSSLLEQNRRSGLSNLKSLLGSESQNAWEERLTLARREGEELSTKLLLPLFIMLGIVMMMIIVPALLIFY